VRAIRVRGSSASVCRRPRPFSIRAPEVPTSGSSPLDSARRKACIACRAERLPALPLPGSSLPRTFASLPVASPPSLIEDPRSARAPGPPRPPAISPSDFESTSSTLNGGTGARIRARFAALHSRSPSWIHGLASSPGPSRSAVRRVSGRGSGRRLRRGTIAGPRASRGAGETADPCSRSEACTRRAPHDLVAGRRAGIEEQTPLAGRAWILVLVLPPGNAARSPRSLSALGAERPLEVRDQPIRQPPRNRAGPAFRRDRDERVPVERCPFVPSTVFAPAVVLLLRGARRRPSREIPAAPSARGAARLPFTSVSV